VNEDEDDGVERTFLFLVKMEDDRGHRSGGRCSVFL
jgi:hypothetical protein